MNSGQVADRVYGALRARLIERAYLPGQRLDPAILADDLSSSVTPVRDALHRLTGERLVAARTSEGFFVPAIDQIALADLRTWSVDILKAAIAASSHVVSADATAGWPKDPIEHARATMDLFDRIAASAQNPEHQAASAHTEARLAPTYQVECMLFDDLPDEMAAIVSAAARGDRSGLKRLLDRHCRRRLRFGAEIVRLLYRPR